MSIAYLVKKTTVLQNGLKTTVNENIIYPFDDMSIAVSQEELDGKAKVELATTGTIFDIVADSLANSHHEVFGTLSLDTYTTLSTTLSTFNGGGSIEVITANGTQNITKAYLTVGSILQVKFLDSSRPEEVAFYNDQSLHQITWNNEDKQAFTAINAKDVAQDNRLTSIETNVALKANTADVYAKTETYSKTELDSSQAGQDTKIEANRVKNVAQDTRLDSLETLTTQLPDRITTLETTSTSYGTRISAIETKDGVQDADILGLKTRMTAVEGNPASVYKSSVRKWVGTQNGNAPLATSNTSVIELSALVADDTKTFEFTSGKELRIWVKATSASLGSLIIPVDIIAGRTEPLLIEAVKGSTGTTLEVLSALLNTTGQLTITRNAGTDIQFNTIQAVEIKEDILALATSLASKTELSAIDTKATTAGTTATEALAKVNAIDLTPITTNIANNTAAIAVNTTNIAANTTAIAGKQSAIDQSLTTTTKAVVGAINEINAKVNLDDTTLVALETLLGL